MQLSDMHRDVFELFEDKSYTRDQLADTSLCQSDPDGFWHVLHGMVVGGFVFVTGVNEAVNWQLSPKGLSWLKAEDSIDYSRQESDHESCNTPHCDPVGNVGERALQHLRESMVKRRDGLEVDLALIQDRINDLDLERDALQADAQKIKVQRSLLSELIEVVDETDNAPLIKREA